MSDGFRGLRLYNTLTRQKEDFRPIDADHVRVYVCGPTVYDFAHIGNARPVIVFDVLYRLLRHLHGAEHVTYVRNITDLDDKINARALRDHGEAIAAGTLSLNAAIRKVTETTANQFHADVAALGCLTPTHEPRATDFVLPKEGHASDMVGLIQKLIDRGHAYAAKGEILFDTTSMPDYGRLSRRNLDEQQAGARVAVEAHKKHPADFVLWKESSHEEPGWEGRFRLPDGERVIRGRPGWHIECSAMSAAYLGEVFDIHGGGIDLIFPHHENEIAQSRCAHGTGRMANVWMHNGFVQVEGRKMSKSEGNFVTIHDLLHTDMFGGRKWPGEVLRLAMLMTHYREPIDFSVRRLEEAETLLRNWTEFLPEDGANNQPGELDSEFASYVLNDLNIYPALNRLTEIGARVQLGSGSISSFLTGLHILGISLSSYATRLRQSVKLADADFENVRTAIWERLAFIREKNWAQADRIREELAGQGIQLKDGKDPETGERITTWEVKR